MNAGVLICALGAVGVLVLVAWRLVALRTEAWLPAELRSAVLESVEEEISIEAPYAVRGRGDRVYRLEAGLRVPVELKTRDGFNVFETDFAELSLRAWLLRHVGRPTASFGYVVVRDRATGRTQARRVELRDDRYCEDLIHRYQLLTARWVPPRRQLGRKCNSCGHRPLCYAYKQ